MRTTTPQGQPNRRQRRAAAKLRTQETRVRSFEPFLTISNDEERISATNYWSTELAARGLLFLSGNAGAWRLLVPPQLEDQIREMRTGRSVLMAPSPTDPKNRIRVMFDDGSETPFTLDLDRRVLDRALRSGPCRFHVYTRRGLEFTRDAWVSGSSVGLEASLDLAEVRFI